MDITLIFNTIITAYTCGYEISIITKANILTIKSDDGEFLTLNLITTHDIANFAIWLEQHLRCRGPLQEEDTMDDFNHDHMYEMYNQQKTYNFQLNPNNQQE